MKDDIFSQSCDPSFLSVGLALKLAIQTQEGKVQCGSALLGWKERAWLICEWPSQVRHNIICPPGTKCVVSYVYEGKLVGYRSEIRQILAEPVPLLFLSFPHTVEEVVLRKHLRVPSNEPTFLLQMHMSPSAGRTLDADRLCGLLKDLSLSGCSVLLSRLSSTVRPGALMKMEFSLPGIGHVTNLSGIVKNVREQDPHYVLGIEFRFNEMEFIEFRGWGGTVQLAIEQCVTQKHVTVPIVDAAGGSL